MSDPHNDDRLRKALQELPAESASEGFTRGVMNRLDVSEPRPLQFPTMLRYALASAILIAVGFVAGANYRAEKAAAEISAARAQTLRLETSQLLEELEALQKLAKETVPVYYIGGTEDTDLLMEVGPWLDSRTRDGRPEAQPASYAIE